MVFVERFAASLKQLRKERGVSHQMLADRAGVHRSTVSYIESGKIVPTILVAARLAQALEIELDELVRRARSS
ncbi:MAG: XRE family transcriptional regulator [Azospirillum brasilense]|nr:MAG: XRE family transcriptional regulator [Azospirillum brasilense]